MVSSRWYRAKSCGLEGEPRDMRFVSMGTKIKFHAWGMMILVPSIHCVHSSDPFSHDALCSSVGRAAARALGDDSARYAQAKYGTACQSLNVATRHANLKAAVS